jgi:hypothetical protein
MSEQVTDVSLEGFRDAFSRHDVGAILDCFAVGCVF